MNKRLTIIYMVWITYCWLCLCMFFPVNALASSGVWLEDGQVEPGGAVAIPLVIEDVSGIASLMVQVNYDPQVLEFVIATNSLGSVGDAYSLFQDGSQDGVVALMLSREDGEVSGGGVMATLKFRLFPGLNPGSYGEIVIGNVGFADQYGGDVLVASAITGQQVRVWSVFTSADSDGDGLSDYDEQNADGSPDYRPGDTDTDINNPDSDNDGIQDGYEVGNGLNPLVNDALADFDQDGCNNFSEWIAGTKADDGADVFKVQAASSTPAGEGNAIHWDSVQGRLYSIYTHTNLLTDWPSTPVDQVQGDGTPKVYTNSEPGNLRYFKLGVELNP